MATMTDVWPVVRPTLDLTLGWVQIVPNKRPNNTNVPSVRIGVGGGFIFNKAAAEFVPDWVSVLYSPQLNQLAIVATNQTDLGAYKVGSAGIRGSNRTFRIRHMWKQLGELKRMPAQIAGTYPLEVHDGILLVQLPKAEEQEEAA